MGALVVAASGPDEAAWRRRIDRLPVWSVPCDAHVVAVAPHPDDETLGYGGILQLLADADATIDLVAVTDGEASHPGVLDLAARRRRELRAALTELGLVGTVRVHHLGVPDGDVVSHAPELSACLEDLAADAELVLAPWPDDGHADHDAAGRVAAEVGAQLGVTTRHAPIWAWHWHDPRTSALLRSAWRVPLPPEVVTRKRRAVTAYRSQVTAELGQVIVPSHVRRRLLRREEVLGAWSA